MHRACVLDLLHVLLSLLIGGLRRGVNLTGVRAPGQSQTGDPCYYENCCDRSTCGCSHFVSVALEMLVVVVRGTTLVQPAPSAIVAAPGRCAFRPPLRNTSGWWRFQPAVSPHKPPGSEAVSVPRAGRLLLC